MGYVVVRDGIVLLIRTQSPPSDSSPRVGIDIIIVHPLKKYPAVLTQ